MMLFPSRQFDSCCLETNVEHLIVPFLVMFSFCVATGNPPIIVAVQKTFFGQIPHPEKCTVDYSYSLIYSGNLREKKDKICRTFHFYNSTG